MNTKNPEKIYRIHMGPAKYSLDLCDGSERGEYVSQDYILHALGRPHRAINLMYCYYPNDKGWPERASIAFKDKKVGFAWDYPYDDYFPYGGGLNGSRDADVFRQIREIRRHGMDVILTLTIDPKVSDDHLRAIGRDLKKFGRMELRINHEATGDWFSFTKRATYKEIGEFFCHASKIIKEEAPNVKTITCVGGIEDLKSNTITMEEEFKNTILEADIWSVDKYLALHWGWPYDVAEKGGKSFARYPVSEVYEKTKRSWKRYTELNNGKSKPFVMAELNADADVTGPYDQIRMMKEFIGMLKKDPDNWFKGFTFYQFRDRGRLGLETEDPNDKYIGVRQPVMDYYIDLINEPEFMPVITKGKAIKKNEETELRFGASDDAEGIAMEFTVPKNPVFFEAYFEGEAVDYNLMMEVNGQWFYKAPGTKCIDMMEAFYKKKLKGETTLQVKLFAPPETGENEEDILNYRKVIRQLPLFRIECEPVVKRKK